MSSYLLRHALPRTVERGVPTTLDADVRDAAGEVPTLTAATLTITDGGTVILAATNATTLSPLTYDLAALESPLSASWLEVWTVTIGGMQHRLTRPAMHVLHAFRPTITDQDLVERHSDLLHPQVKPSTLDSYEPYRKAAAEKVQRALLRKGRRPHLIFDQWELVDALVECTLFLIFTDFASAIGDGRYRILAEGEDGKGGYGKAWERSFEGAQFRYDSAETGAITTNDTESSSPMVVITAGRPNRGGGYYGPGIGGRR